MDYLSEEDIEEMQELILSVFKGEHCKKFNKWVSEYSEQESKFVIKKNGSYVGCINLLSTKMRGAEHYFNWAINYYKEKIRDNCTMLLLLEKVFKGEKEKMEIEENVCWCCEQITCNCTMEKNKFVDTTNKVSCLNHLKSINNPIFQNIGKDQEKN